MVIEKADENPVAGRMCFILTFSRVMVEQPEREAVWDSHSENSPEFSNPMNYFILFKKKHMLLYLSLNDPQSG